ncbi:MAG: FeoA family protein [Halorhabdus sp.]
MSNTRSDGGRSGRKNTGDGRRRGKRRRQCQRKCNGQCKRLADVDCGEEGTVEQISDRFREYLRSMGIRPGKEITVCSKQPFEGPVVVSIGRSTVSLSRSQARALEIIPKE